ncbi:hypothetical protein JCM8097_009354 [Rhodosporidiobolus ruineniae]
MPPFRDPNRLFYDPANPVMLSEDQISELSPQELQAAMDQLDQNLVLVLQEIEENFALCNNTVTERIIPAVAQHGENSMRIYESIKFWRPFFEAAASTRLNQQDEAETSYDGAEEPVQNTASPDRPVSDEGDLTYGPPSVGGTPRAATSVHAAAGDVSSAGSPSEPHWSKDISPFQALQADMHAGAEQAALPEVQRLRLRDLPPDSPDFPEPQYDPTATIGVSPSQGKGKTRNAPGDSFDLSSAGPSEPSFLTAHLQPQQLPPQSPARAPRAGGDKAHSALLQKILRKNLASPARPPPSAARHHGPGSSTPGPGTAKKLQFPPEAHKNWDGIANLSQTSLDAFPSPIKRRTSAASSYADASFAHAPPSSARPAGGALSSSTYSSRGNPLLSASASSRHAVPPSPAFTRTPAKEAARRTAQNVYNALDAFDLLDSPMLEPPSALKGPMTQVYRFDPTASLGGAAGADEPPSPSERGTARRPVETLGGGGRYTALAANESYASSIPAQPSFANRSETRPFDLAALSPSAGGLRGAAEASSASLADFGGGTTANLDELLGGHTTTFNPRPFLTDAGGGDYAGIVGDDDEERYGAVMEGGSFTDTGSGADGTAGAGGKRRTEETFTATQPYGLPAAGGEEEYYDDEDEFRAAGVGRGVRLPGQDGPEDTLFGMPPARSGASSSAAFALSGAGAGAGAKPKRGVSFGGAMAHEYSAEQSEDGLGAEGQYVEEDSFAEEARQSGFRLHGLSEMETLHGGELLASEPFQASPLAGRSGQ